MKLPVVVDALVPLDHSHGTTSSAPNVVLTVFCPDQEKHIGVETCVRCTKCTEVRAIPGGFVDCVSTKEKQANQAAYRPPQVDIGERAAKLPLSEIVKRNAVCVVRDTSLDSVSALFLHGDVDCAPVVDADGGLIGIVSKSDLLRHVEKLGSGTVADVMTPCVHALPDNSTLAYAFALMAFEKLQYVPVVSKDGAVVGVLTALDVVRWVTDEWGFISFTEK